MEEKLRNILNDINSLIAECEVISGSWNGDESGSQEDLAHEADDVSSYLELAQEEILGALRLYE